MVGEVCTRWRAFTAVATLLALMGAPAVVNAQSAPTSFKVAFINIKSGKGQVGLKGRAVLFANTNNCTDTTAPMNAWGTGFVQQHLTASVGNDPSVVALGLAESWASVCASPERVRALLGWKARTSERNGVALVARYGFAGPEEWLQLDTTLNPNPADTMWVLRRPVCLDEACTESMNVFVSHWYAEGTAQTESYDRQAVAAADFVKRTGGNAPHVLVGDLNVWEGTAKVCGQIPDNVGVQRLRDAGYTDAWLALRGTAEGFTGMLNRTGCGSPEGYAWKRPDYVWTPASLPALSIQRFGVVTAGDPAPSDHYGLIAEFAMPGTAQQAPMTSAPEPILTTPPPASSTTSAPAIAADIVLYAKNATTIAGNWRLVDDAQAAGGARMWNPDASVAKLAAPLAAPSNYFELTFQAEAGKAYRLWMRGRADRDYYGNDSAYVQFSDSVTDTGVPTDRIGTTAGTWIGVEEGSSCGLSGWGWQDDGYGVNVLGPLVYFATTGTHTIRVQQREDGLSIDQIVLSSSAYLTASPGATKNDTVILPMTVETAAVVPVTEIAFGASTPAALSGTWRSIADSTAANGVAVGNPDAGAAKVLTASATPANFVEFTFTADAGRAYRLWLRGRADRDSYANDSVFVQFNGSVNDAGAPVARIGTTDALVVNLEDCSGCGVSGWGWQDTGYGAGVLGPLVTFQSAGTQTIRIQTREDGLRIDQIVLSAEKYLTTAPGALKNDCTNLLAPPPAPEPPPVIQPTPTPTPGSPVSLRVLQWNLHHGVGTDGVYDLDRIATWMAKMNPDVVMLNEVEKYTGWGNEDQPERYRAMLEAKTNRTWYVSFTQEFGNWTSNGKGHVILSVFPFESINHTTLTPSSGLNGAGAMGQASVIVNGRTINLVISHLDPESLAMRLTQAKETIAWALTFAENRIVTGDMNAWPDQSSIAEFNKTYKDSWVEATDAGTAVAFAGNSPVGATKKGRIDYIFFSTGAPDLSVVGSQVYDTRDGNGVMPSDHRPVVTTFQVR